MSIKVRYIDAIKKKMPSEGNFKEVLKGSSLSFIFRIAGLGLAYLITYFIANEWGAEVVGRYAISTVVLQFSFLFFSAGIPLSIVKFTTNKAHYLDGVFQTDYLKKSLSLLFFIGLAGSFILYNSANEISVYIFNDQALAGYLKIVAFGLTPFILLNAIGEFTRGKQDLLRYSVIAFFSYNFFAFTFLIASSLFYKTETVAISSFVGAIFASFFIFFIAFLKKEKIRQYKAAFNYKEIFSLSFPMLFSSALMFITSWTDTIMLGIFNSNEEVGIYNVAFKIANLNILVIGVINTTIAPKISRLFHNGQLHELKGLIKNTTKLTVIATLPIAVGIIAFGQEVVGFFGQEFERAYEPLLYLTIGQVFNACSGSVGQILNMTNKQKLLRNLTITSTGINIVANYLMIPVYGAVGAAIASLMSNVLLNLLCMYFIKREFNFITFYIPGFITKK